MISNRISIKNRIVFLISVMFILTFVFTACDDVKLPTDEEGIDIYYINEEGMGLTCKKYVLTGKDRDARIKEVIDELKKSEVKYISAIDDKVDITEAVVDNRKLNITLTNSYNELTTVEKMFLRSAMVLSLTEVNGVDSVEFYVGTETAKYADGTNIGPLRASDFVDINNNDINNYNTQVFSLYFSNLNGDMLRKVSVECICSTNVSIERYVVELLIEGTDDKMCKNTLAAETKINSIITKDGVCYVDFSEAIMSENMVDEEVSIYSIINSLSELAHITKVQISVNGSTDVKYGDVDLSKPLSRNLNIVENNIENKAE